MDYKLHQNYLVMRRQYMCVPLSVWIDRFSGSLHDTLACHARALNSLYMAYSI